MLPRRHVQLARPITRAVTRGAMFVAAVLLPMVLTLAGFARDARAERSQASGREVSGASGTDTVLGAPVDVLARLVLARLSEPSEERRLDHRFRLELLAGRPDSAAATLMRLRALRLAHGPTPAAISSLSYEIYADALLRRRTGSTFDDAYRAAFDATLRRMDDRSAAHPVRWVFGTLPERLEADLRAARARAATQTGLTLADTLDLLRKLLAVDVLHRTASLVPPLLGDDDERRYQIERNVRIGTPDGATICALIVRPRAARGRLPTLLNFTVYADTSNNLYEARRTASNGYVGVVALTRGKRCSSDRPVPIEHDGADAATVIDWISRQPWSDGRVGMYGGSYEGFTQWAAAKHRPAALKAMMPSVTFAPGVDFPMEGNVFMTYAFPWPLYTTTGKELDSATYFDDARWTRMMQAWYASGRAYRDLDAIAEVSNPIFRKWISHPSYDDYWRALTPSADEYAHLDIPVLTTTGYYDSGQIGALHYFRQHLRYRPRAMHYLLIGPYDHGSGQRGTISPLGRIAPTLRGYTLDSVAHVDIGELRYQWFDYVLRHGPKPALLQDRVNYEVMGANRWRHASSLAGVSNATLRFYLTADPAAQGFRLSAHAPAAASKVSQTVDLAGRRGADVAEGSAMIDQALDSWPIVDTTLRIGNAIRLTSDPLPAAVEVSGLFSGQLELMTNKRDFDVSVTVYEQTAAGELLHLAHYWTRASYAANRSRRALLMPDHRQHIVFESGRFTSRRVQAGSRVVVVLGIIKQPWEQINYGTGKDVSDETIADAKEPLRIEWLAGTVFQLPVRR